MTDTNRLSNERDAILRQVRVLYVEDEAPTREELCEFLRRRAGKIYTAQNGKEGLALYEEYLPDIVIADLFMPEMDGIEMVRRIKKAHFPGPSVIITSAIGDVNVILGAVDAGIDKYIIKPIDIGELLTSLQQLAERAVGQSRPPIDPAQKKQIEDTIKKDFSAFLKNAAGKGPRDISVFIGENDVEVIIYDFMTPLEKSLLDNNQNFAIIEQNRSLFYSIKGSEICAFVGAALARDCRIEKVTYDLKKDRNKLILTID